MNKQELILRGIALYGKEAQFRQFHEEIGELMVSVSHYQRGRCSLDDIIVEIADVIHMIEVIKVLFKIDPKKLEKIDKKQWKKFEKQMDKYEKKLEKQKNEEK